MEIHASLIKVSKHLGMLSLRTNGVRAMDSTDRLAETVGPCNGYPLDMLSTSLPFSENLSNRSVRSNKKRAYLDFFTSITAPFDFVYPNLERKQIERKLN